MVVFIALVFGLRPLFDNDSPGAFYGVLSLVAIVTVLVLPIYGGYIFIRSGRLVAKNGNKQQIKNTPIALQKSVRPLMKGIAIGTAIFSGVGSIILTIIAISQPGSVVSASIVPFTVIFIGAAVLSCLRYVTAYSVSKDRNKNELLRVLTICVLGVIPAIIALGLSLSGIV
ncbi:MAG TPA: hypothetical protein PLY16_01190 [Candidatus Saccharibacteria bacterium]|nr:hypothetical protein [Candidatus Saccharibacteria bacterium]